jgi:hypothetical protein
MPKGNGVSDKLPDMRAAGIGAVFTIVSIGVNDTHFIVPGLFLSDIAEDEAELQIMSSFVSSRFVKQPKSSP